MPIFYIQISQTFLDQIPSGETLVLVFFFSGEFNLFLVEFVALIYKMPFYSVLLNASVTVEWLDCLLMTSESKKYALQCYFPWNIQASQFIRIVMLIFPKSKYNIRANCTFFSKTTMKTATATATAATTIVMTTTAAKLKLFTPKIHFADYEAEMKFNF